MGRFWDAYRERAARRRKSPRQRALIENLESRTLMSITAINPLPAEYGAILSVPAKKTLIVPITAEADKAVTYTVSAPKGWTVTVLNPEDAIFVNFHVSYGANATEGDIVIQLFPNLAPNTVDRILDLVNDGKYDGTPFQRIIDDFIVQGGDVGDGVDPDTIGDGTEDADLFADEFSPNAIFSGLGQLAMTNSGKDTNGSQFFLTYFDPAHTGASAPRFLDFNHTIFGQVVRGMDVLAAINSVPKQSGTATPVDDVTLMSATVVTNETDATITIKGPSASSKVVPITITATDEDGNVETTVLSAKAVSVAVKDPPILANVPNQFAAPGKPIVIKMSAIDIDGGGLQYAVFAAPAGMDQPPSGVTGKVSGSTITIYPPDGVYQGSFPVTVGVRQSGATSRGSTLNPWDTEVIYLTWTDDATPPTASAQAKPVYGSVVNSTFTVTYTSDKQIGVNSIKNNHKAVSVLTPGGKLLAARYVSLVVSADGKSAEVTYRVTGPGGVWDAKDAGTYKVVLNSNRILDAVGNPVAAGELTTFFYSPTVAFNEAWYLQENPQVAADVQAHTYTSGYQQFLLTGQYVAAAPSIYFDEAYYLANNPSVQGLIDAGKYVSAFAHFVKVGMAANLNGSAAFDQQAYLDEHPEIAQLITKKKYVSPLDYYVKTGVV